MTITAPAARGINTKPWPRDTDPDPQVADSLYAIPLFASAEVV